MEHLQIPVNRIALPLLGLSLVLAWTPSVWAAGPGVRAGDFEIHPKARFGVAQNTNMYLEDSTEAEVSGTLVNVGAGVGLKNRRPNKLGVKLGLESDFRFLVNNSEPEPGGNQQAVDSLNGFDRARGDLTVALFPRSSFTLQLADQLRYTDRPAFDSVEQRFQRLDNAIGADLRFRPGDNPDARALELRLGWRWRAVRFLDGDALGVSGSEKDAQEFRLLSRWKFLPKTALFADFKYHIITYEADGASSSPLRLEIGVQGLVTQRVSVVLKGGFLGTFNEADESYNGPVGTISAQYILEPTLKLKAQYSFDAKDSGFANFYTAHRISGGGGLRFLARFSFDAKIGVDLISYSTAGSVFPDFPREDTVLRAKVGFGYDLQEWLVLGLEYSYGQNLSDYLVPREDDAGQVTQEGGNPVAYTQHVVALQLNAEY